MKQTKDSIVLLTTDRRSNAPSVLTIISLNTPIRQVADACEQFGYDAEISSVVR